MKKLILIVVLTILSGCLPEVPEIPAIPTGAACSMDGFVLRPVNYTNFSEIEFVLDETGEAMTCVFTYEV